MGYIYGLIVVGVLLLAMHYFTELTAKQKLSITLLLAITILSALFYNHYMNEQREKMLAIVVAYKQGKTIHCNGKDVNSSTYTLSTGTYTFIGKENTPHYAEMINAYECK